MEFTSSNSSLPTPFPARSGRRLVNNKANSLSSLATPEQHHAFRKGNFPNRNRSSNPRPVSPDAVTPFDPNPAVTAALPSVAGSTPPLTPATTLKNHQFWAKQLVQAFEQHCLELFLQPIVALPTYLSSPSPVTTSTPSRHYEVLLRMKYPVPLPSITAPTTLAKTTKAVGGAGGYAPTLAVIQAAEFYGLMPRLDLWVIATALQGSRYFLEELEPAADTRGHEPNQGVVTLAINLSASSVCDQGFEKAVLKNLDNWLATTNVSTPIPAAAVGVGSSGCANSSSSSSSSSKVRPIQICFELTELSCVSNWKQALHFMHSVRVRGCKFAFDDAGSGWASFDYLRKLRSTLDFLKIDSSLVEAMLDDPLAYAMVKSLHQIAHIAGLKTVAEGASSDKIIRSLVGLGVDFGQGYALGRPMPWPNSTPPTSD